MTFFFFLVIGSVPFHRREKIRALSHSPDFASSMYFLRPLFSLCVYVHTRFFFSKFVFVLVSSKSVQLHVCVCVCGWVDAVNSRVTLRLRSKPKMHLHLRIYMTRVHKRYGLIERWQSQYKYICAHCRGNIKYMDIAKYYIFFKPHIYLGQVKILKCTLGRRDTVRNNNIIFTWVKENENIKIMVSFVWFFFFFFQLIFFNWWGSWLKFFSAVFMVFIIVL